MEGDAVDHPEIPIGPCDSVDAGAFSEFDDATVLLENPSVENPSNLSSTFTRQRAGDLLMQEHRNISARLQLPRKSAGEILISSSLPIPTAQKCDTEVTVEDVFREPTPIEFEAEGASDAVMHFFGKFESPPQNDDVDAGGQDNPEWRDPYGEGLQTASVMEGVSPIQPSTLARYEGDYEYNMKYPERGCFVIFNQKNFDASLNMDRRDGTDKDAVNLEYTAKNLGFEYVKTFNDSTRKEMIDWCEKIASSDHSDYDCFFCCILTHGGYNDVLYAKDATFELKDLTRPFGGDKCPSLAGKPKLFFVQACRGYKLDAGVKVHQANYDAVDGSFEGDTVDGSPLVETTTIPAEADFLIGQSTVTDYYSWRNKSNGSIFIQHLCACLNEFGKYMEIMQIMTRVNRMTAYEFESNSGRSDMNNKKQIPSITTRLTAELRFASKVCSEPPQIETDHGSVQVVDTSATGDASYPSSNYNTSANNGSAPPPPAPSHKRWVLPNGFYPPRLPPRAKSSSAKKASSASSRRSPTLVGSAPGISRIPVPNGKNPKRYSAADVQEYSRSFDSASHEMHKSRTTPQMASRSSGSATPHRRSLPTDPNLDYSNGSMRVGRYHVKRDFEETPI